MYVLYLDVFKFLDWYSKNLDIYLEVVIYIF